MSVPLLTVSRAEALTLRRVGGGVLPAGIAGLVLLVGAQMPAFAPDLQRRLLWEATEAALLLICSILPLAGSRPPRTARIAPARWVLGAWLGSLVYGAAVTGGASAAALVAEGRVRKRFS